MSDSKIAVWPCGSWCYFPDEIEQMDCFGDDFLLMLVEAGQDPDDLALLVNSPASLARPFSYMDPLKLSE